MSWVLDFLAEDLIHGVSPTPSGELAWSRREGHGPTFVCIPGLGDTRAQFRRLDSWFHAHGFRAIYVDPRGQGDSSAGPTSYDADATGADLVAILNDLDPRDVHLVGHSAGAAAALVAAATVPDRIRSLTLIGPFVRADVELTFGQRLALAVGFGGPWAPWAWGAYYRGLFPKAPPPDQKAYVAALVASLRQPGRTAALRASLHASKAAADASLESLRLPSIVLMGTADPDYPDPRAEADLVARRLGGRVVMLDGLGHYPHLEAPDLVGKILADTLGLPHAA